MTPVHVVSQCLSPFGETGLTRFATRDQQPKALSDETSLPKTISDLPKRCGTDLVHLWGLGSNMNPNGTVETGSRSILKYLRYVQRHRQV